MEQWFIQEWHDERDANRTFRENVLQRLTALETTGAIEEKQSDNTHTRWPAWLGVAVAAAALVISLLALV